MKAESHTLHMKVQWGGEIPTVIDDGDLNYSVRPAANGQWRVVVKFEAPDFGGMLLEDEDGAILCWNDFVANEWVEQYSSVPGAMMRLALLLDATEREAFFVNDPLVFAKNAFEFMHREAPTASS